MKKLHAAHKELEKVNDINHIHQKIHTSHVGEKNDKNIIIFSFYY